MEIGVLLFVGCFVTFMCACCIVRATAWVGALPDPRGTADPCAYFRNLSEPFGTFRWMQATLLACWFASGDAVSLSHTCVIAFLANCPMYFCPIGSSSIARISNFRGSPSVRLVSLPKSFFSVSSPGRIYSKGERERERGKSSSSQSSKHHK